MKQIRENWGMLLFGLAVLAIMYVAIFRTHEVQVQGKCTNKFITWDRYGEPEYYLNFQRADGTYYEQQTTVTGYNGTTVGTTYSWKETEVK